MAETLNDNKTWYLGLDIGTSSVGWAVTDEQYNIPRLRGQRAWGVRLFEEAQTAADRRAHRTARRRYYRRAERLKYLRQIFAPYIEAIDPGFFERMQDSFFWSEDKRESTPEHPQKNSLFNDANYTDANYYKDFPTIFHLRDYLMNPDACHSKLHPQTNPPKKLDARHYYLACHHIIKYRGHFLFEGDIEIDTANTANKFSDLYERLQVDLLENCGFEFGVLYETNTAGDICEIPFSQALLDMLSSKGRLNDKKARVKTLNINCDMDEDGRETANNAAQLIAAYMLGSKVDFANIAECEGKAEIQLGQGSTDDKLAELPDKIGQNWQSILEIGKELYDIGVARQIIGEHATLSASFISLYDRYREELDLYNSSEPIAKEKQTHQLAQPRTIIDENGREKQQSKIVKPKLRGYYSGAIPMQLHLAELKAILKSFAADQRYQAFATASTCFKDDPTSVTGASNTVLDADKIIKLLTHRVPYYVGPLQTNQGDAKTDANSGKQAQTSRQKPWIVRNLGQEQAKIYPWNFSVVVNKAASAENFIARMVGRCSYLADQPCLPKDSVLYQRYMILNELNKLRLNANPIDVQTKQELFSQLFMVKTDIKLSTIKNWFASRGCSGEVALADSAGTGGTINHKMTSYLKFKAVLGDAVEKLLPQIEEAILAITVLPDDKEMLNERVRAIFAAELDAGIIGEDAIKKIAGFNFAKWGNFSAKLLDGIKATVQGGGQPVTIIEALWQTNQNFMELAAGVGPFAPEIEAYQAQNGNRQADELIEDSYASVPVKRACRQAIKIVRELEGIIGCSPAKVFIEAPRSHEESRRTDDRKKQLERIYGNIKDDVRNYQETKNELSGYDNQELKPKAVYLYFLQNGRCAYSGEPLNIGDLTQTCDIDHIIPQAMLKDDSFDNLVLVKKELNRAKSDSYPFNTVPEINFSQMLPIWKSWYKNGLITSKKFRSLSRTTLTMEEIAGFINRQLVETSQTTKMVMDILKLVMPSTQIVYQKAETVAEFRREWAQYEGTTSNGRFLPERDENGNKIIRKLIKPCFIKVRELNDLHHAKDAYLNIVVGNVYSTKFTNNPRTWLRDTFGDKPQAVKLSMRTVMYDDRKILHDGSRGEVKKIADRNGVIVWDESCLQTVKETFERNDVLVTVRSFEKHGSIYDQNLLGYEEGKIRFPIKKGMDVEKYGGYTGSYTAYFAYIRTAKGKKRFAAIPLRFKDKPGEYLAAEFPRCSVLLDRILVKSTLLVNGHPVTLDGSSGTSMACSNFKALFLYNDDAIYLAKLLKAKDKMSAVRGYIIDSQRDGIYPNMNVSIYKKFLELAKGAFCKRPNISGVAHLLESEMDRFENLELNEQVTMLISVFKLFQRVPFASSAVDCTLLGGKKNTGNTSFSTYEEDIKLIIPSVTGLYKKVIDLGAL